MRGYMFKNRWGALLFVCLTAIGAASLIGGEDDQGLLLSATDELTDARDGLDSRRQELSRPDERPVLDAGNVGEFSSDDELVAEYLSDEELIDDTQGLEPEPDINPSVEGEGEGGEDEGDVVMYIDDD